ncbi:translation initiation factor [Hufsiella ginkgonis]|uniref:Translation initiation factor n=1 Tax=Hufsiella ginkgonis TaxID=2695274 RepID=A0A7K1Y2M3_9SPHI|nr:translation initiation factor [Hufsiella ginkgonis]MXV17534.1 translation initiation factor [Hufsiella ginkgonis]
MSSDKRSKKFNSFEGIVYSTDPDHVYQAGEVGEPPAPPPGAQHLKVQLDKKQRGGKKVTLVTGFSGSAAELQALGRELKQKCGVGGSTGDGEILVQGDFRDKVIAILQAAGYHVKRVGG